MAKFTPEIVMDFNVLTIGEVAKALRKTESTVRTWINRGVIPRDFIKKIGCSVYVKKDKFLEWMVA